MSAYTTEYSFEPVELPSHYAKAIVAILTAALTVLVTALGDQKVDLIELTHMALAVSTAISVYLIPNLSEGTGRYAKAIVAVLGAALQGLLPLLIDGNLTSSDWIVIMLAALGAISVGIVPNTQPGYLPERALDDPGVI